MLSITCNEDRAGRALHALDAYKDCDGDAKHYDRREAVGDLLCDLMHLCAGDGIDFEDVLSGAELTHAEEEADEAAEDAEEADVGCLQCGAPTTPQCVCAEIRLANEESA